MRNASLFFIGALFAVCSSAQVFDVASVKPSASGEGGGSTNMTATTFTARNVPLRSFIAVAHQAKGIDVDGRMIQGAVQTGRITGADGLTMANLARALADGFGAPVVDETGTTNYFLVNLEFSPVDIDVEHGGGLKPSLMTALREQAGLQLDRAQVSVKHVIVDSVERNRTEN